MCGIAGSAESRGAADPAVVERQLALLGHRGPDAAGMFARGGGAVGATRLAVLDLVTGDPPILSEDTRLGVALNGEIYNFALLREELMRQGHEFRSRGDTEVIAHLAEELDPVELCSRLEGMFAFALWDSARRRLVLGRDRLGKKPLYYWHQPGSLVFGSEIKAVLVHPRVPRTLDPGAPGAYLTFGYVPTPRTFFDGIVSLPPGHVLTFNAETGSVVVERYWEPPVAGVDGVSRLPLSLPEAARELRVLLEDAVRARLIADVPVGAFLSGGVDSSSVVALMAQLTSAPVRTFTIGFEERRFDERRFAREVSENHGTDHVEMVVRPPTAELVERLLWHHDQPFGDLASLPTFLLSELAREHVTVALCGDGGDELFAGYPRLVRARRAGYFVRVPPVPRTVAVRATSLVPEGMRGGRWRRLRRALDDGQHGPLGVLLSSVTHVPPDVQSSDGAWAVEDFRRTWRASEGAMTLGRVLDLNLRTYLLDDLLPKVDRTSMAHGLEVRSPFLDHRLVEFALRLPPSHLARGLLTKRVLKAAVADLVPSRVIERSKHGFNVPVDQWFRSDLEAYVRGVLGSPTARVRDHLHPASLDRLLVEHQRGIAHGQRLWIILMLELFLRREGW